jgi:transcriptional regulator with XRE-family HTH domain
MRPRLDYGRAIETLRASKHLTREEVARLAGISYSYLSEIERGLKRPSSDIVARIARAFGMKGSAFLQYVEELSAPLPDDLKPVAAVQLPLRRNRPLSLFTGDQALPAARRADAAGAGGADRGDLVISELLVIARRLGAADRQALLQLARHLLHRGGR